MKVSVVVPVYCGATCLKELAARLRAAFEKSGRAYELILVNDGSPDRSWQEICQLAAEDKAVVGINLRKNAGQDNAIMAGLKEASGEVILIMDDDLQHDPDDAEALIRQVEAGFDLCYARFPKKKQAYWKNFGSWLNHRLANIVIDKPKDIYLSPFKAIARQVAREIIDYAGPFPYVDGLLFRVCGNVTQVEVQHHLRFAGTGNYTLARSIGVLLKVATVFSLAPLRIATMLGFTFAAVGFLLALFFTAERILSDAEPAGWASSIVAVLVLGGIQLTSLGILGEYVGRVFLHLNKSPQYVVKEKIDNRL